jgi:succinate-semialdehyde dehydrogenase/glutarate-semialdehyde dehydrogenase
MQLALTMSNANRFLVQEGIAAKFTAALVPRVEQLKVGPGMNKTTTQGPLVNAAAVNKVRKYVEDAVSKGAKVATSGRPPNSPGFFYPPTVMTGVTKEMKVFREETFGPLAPIITFKTEAEAVKLANDTDTGLSDYFFTRDVNRALRVGRRLQCGMVGVNMGKISACETQFGGIKESGYGREGSKYGMDEYQVIKAITVGNIDV